MLEFLAKILVQHSNHTAILLYLAMGQEQVGHLVAFLPHVLVVAELLHCSLEDLSKTS